MKIPEKTIVNLDKLKNCNDCIELKSQLEKERTELGTSKEDKKRKIEIREALTKLKFKFNEFTIKYNEVVKELKKGIKLKEEEKERELRKTKRDGELKQIKEELKDSENIEVIKDLFKGDTRTLKHFKDNKRLIVYSNSNFELEYDPYSKNFDMFFEYETKDGFNKELFGGFSKVRRIKRNETLISDNIENKKSNIIEIYNVSGNDETYVKEFDLNQNRWEEIGQHVKIGNQRGQYVALPRKVFASYLNHSNLIETELENITDCYGIFSKKDFLLPNKYNLKSNIQKNAEVKSFEKLINSPEIKKEELKEIAIKLKLYLEHSKATQLSFFFSLVGVFRYNLMDKGLKEFPFFALKSSVGSRGKSTRLKITNNLFLTGYNSEGITQSELKGTGVRLNSYQYINLPLLIDDASAFNNETLIGLFKTLATSKYVEQSRGKPNGEIIKYHVLRPLICSFNRLLIPDINLVRRFIIIDLDNNLVNEEEKEPKEDLILYLENNISDLGNYFWKHQDLFLPLIENVETKRADAKETILTIGFNICNKIFESLGINPLTPFAFKPYLTDAKNYVATSEDDFKTELKSQLQILTLTRVQTFNAERDKEFFDYNLFDFIGNEIEKEIKIKVLTKAHHKGIYLYKDNILITRKTLEYFKFKSIKLKKTTDLKEFFDEKEYELKTGDEGGINPEGKFGTKKGFLLKLDHLVEKEDKQTEEKSLEENKNEPYLTELKIENKIKEFEKIDLDEITTDLSGEVF